MGDTALSAYYATVAKGIQAAIVSNLWVADKEAFRDNPTSDVLPQDGNSLAVWFGVVTGANATKVSDYLNSNWGTYGSSSPEWNNDIGRSPFVSVC